MSAVGYSGVLFAYAAQESMLGGGTHRSLFGFVNIPVKYYPWAMLLAMQIMIENVSFVGHLGGLLIGLAHVRCAVFAVYLSPACCGGLHQRFEPCSGWLNWMLPSRQAVEAIEALQWMEKLRSLPNFVPSHELSFGWSHLVQASLGGSTTTPTGPIAV
jgi:Rhomboid family